MWKCIQFTVLKRNRTEESCLTEKTNRNTFNMCSCITENLLVHNFDEAVMMPATTKCEYTTIEESVSLNLCLV